MFYERQTKEDRDNYKKMLSIMGELTLLFSESDCPYLPYRAHENIFCKYLKAENLARGDCSADAKKNRIGIGLKTWVGSDDQKVAEFGKLKPEYKSLKGMELVKRISHYRNERIRVTKNLQGIDDMIYHVVKRIPGKMEILECPFKSIDIENIEVISNRGNANNTYFTDGVHIYHFSESKNTLYMIFDDLELLDSITVRIFNEPYDYLMRAKTYKMKKDPARFDFVAKEMTGMKKPDKEQICLRLYSTKKDGTKFVGEKSGLNQWNAGGRPRNEREIYIPYPSEDRKRNPGFFPERDTPFEVALPDGNVISAKRCQADGKAIMSNPNKVLGEWLLGKVFELENKTLITYDMLEVFGIDSVIFTKDEEGKYSVNFAEIGTYEDFVEEISSLE